MAATTDRPNTAPATPAPARPGNEMQELRALVLAQAEIISELRDRLDQVAPASGKRERKEPVYAKAPWEEEVWVEALEEGYYPEPHDTYAIVRHGRMEVVNAEGELTVKRGTVFRLQHREHLAAWMQELDSKDAAVQAHPTKRVPQTTVRATGLRSPTV